MLIQFSLLLSLSTGCSDKESNSVIFDESAGEDSGAEWEDYGNFDPEHVVQISLTMNEEDWDALRNQSRNFLTEFRGDCMDEPFSYDYTYFSAEIDMDGVVVELNNYVIILIHYNSNSR